MSKRSTRLLKTALSALHVTGAHRLVAPHTRGCGVIFMLHRVAPEPVAEFEPNRILRITPDFLEEVIEGVRALGTEFVSLDEARERLLDPRPAAPPFACLTFDDGYRDNLEHALPVLEHHGVPATVYIPAGYPAGGADLWWLTLERVFRVAETVSVRHEGRTTDYPASTLAEKEQSFSRLYWWLRPLPEHQARAIVRDLGAEAGIDPETIARDLVMTWDEVHRLAASPLITIGAHTCDHLALSKLPVEDCVREIRDSVRILEEKLARPCRHFAYPYGDEGSAGEREFEIAERLGLATAVTTRKGVIHPADVRRLTALPRLSLNGDFQDMRHVAVLMSGAPFAMWNTVTKARSLARRAAAAWA